MKEKVYDIILNVYKTMNREFSFALWELTDDKPLASLGVDSLTFIMIMVNVENTLGISVDEENATACKTVGDLMAMIEAAK